MPIIIIAAYAGRNQVVGKDGDLPWHFPSDLKFFKQTTIGHPVLMGSVTYQSILKRLKKPLPDRETIVITNDPSFRDERVKIIHSFKEIESYRNRAEPLFIIGGAKVYSQSMDIAQEMLITHIEQEVEGDA
ncbi:MAG TPA: dihydrofolate reductase, partial [Alphaproteobacteria bacterium]|nr:dihydrofolate reductase [Alphaproteobacteria bacterium]